MGQLKFLYNIYKLEDNITKILIGSWIKHKELVSSKARIVAIVKFQ